jgi:hypothetical protein
MIIKKHVGIVNNLGSRVIIVFREIPEDKDFCLVVEADRLPDYLADTLNDAVNSNEAQQTINLYEILNRCFTPDGENLLTALHNKKHLMKKSVDDIIIVPSPGYRLPLRTLNDQVNGETEANDTIKENMKAKDIKDPVYAKTIPINEDEDPLMVALALLKQAELLEEDAKLKRRQAHSICPDAKLNKPAGRPTDTPEQRKVKQEEYKQKRLERDRRNAAAKKLK